MKDEILEVSVSDTMCISNSIRIGSTDDRTNRNVIHYDSSHSTKSIELDTLIMKFVETRTNELADFFALLVRDFSTLFYTTTKCFFRGLHASVEAMLQGDRIGPSPNPKDSRYSVKGERCLYLVDDKKFLDKELKTSSLLIQEYNNIPFNSMSIADLSPENRSLDNSMALAFQRAESGRTAAGYDFEKGLRDQGESRYLVSQLLAGCFKKQDWHGLFVPGVHGGSDNHYHNLTIFRSKISTWRDWTEKPYYHA